MWIIIFLVAVVLGLYFISPVSMSSSKEKEKKYYLFDYEKDLAIHFYKFIHNEVNEMGLRDLSGYIYNYGILRIENKKFANYLMSKDEYAIRFKEHIYNKINEKIENLTLYEMTQIEVEKEVLDLIVSMKNAYEKMAQFTTFANR